MVRSPGIGVPMPGLETGLPGGRRGQGSDGGTPAQAYGWRGLERPTEATTRAVGRPLTERAEREGCSELVRFERTGVEPRSLMAELQGQT